MVKDKTSCQCAWYTISDCKRLLLRLIITSEHQLGACTYLTLSSLKHYEVKYYYHHVIGEKNETQKDYEN